MSILSVLTSAGCVRDGCGMCAVIARDWRVSHGSLIKKKRWSQKKKLTLQPENWRE